MHGMLTPGSRAGFLQKECQCYRLAQWNKFNRDDTRIYLDLNIRHFLLLTGTYHEVAILDFNSATAVCMPSIEKQLGITAAIAETTGHVALPRQTQYTRTRSKSCKHVLAS